MLGYIALDRLHVLQSRYLIVLYTVRSRDGLRFLLFPGMLRYCCHAVTRCGSRRQNSNWEGADFTNAVVDRVSFDGSSMKVSQRYYYTSYLYTSYIRSMICVCVASMWCWYLRVCVCSKKGKKDVSALLPKGGSGSGIVQYIKSLS